jgi:predicted flap endonuclease-1-like 5' DNA nuclease
MTGIVIAFVLGAIVGVLIAWYPSRLQRRACEAEVQNLRTDLSSAQRRLEKQEADLQHHAEQLRGRDRTVRDLTAQLEWRKITIDQFKEVVQDKESQLQSVKAPAGEIEPDDLKRIEGIGPRISQLLQDAGILTFGQLAAAEVARLREIIADAGLSALADPATWPEQAQLAADGDWEALQTLQDELAGGRRAAR